MACVTKMVLLLSAITFQPQEQKIKSIFEKSKWKILITERKPISDKPHLNEECNFLQTKRFLKELLGQLEESF